MPPLIKPGASKPTPAPAPKPAPGPAPKPKPTGPAAEGSAALAKRPPAKAPAPAKPAPPAKAPAPAKPPASPANAAAIDKAVPKGSPQHRALVADQRALDRKLAAVPPPKPKPVFRKPGASTPSAAPTPAPAAAPGAKPGATPAAKPGAKPGAPAPVAVPKSTPPPLRVDPAEANAYRAAQMKIRADYYRTHPYHVDTDGTAYKASFDARSGTATFDREDDDEPTLANDGKGPKGRTKRRIVQAPDASQARTKESTWPPDRAKPGAGPTTRIERTGRTATGKPTASETTVRTSGTTAGVHTDWELTQRKDAKGKPASATERTAQTGKVDGKDTRAVTTTEYGADPKRPTSRTLDRTQTEGNGRATTNTSRVEWNAQSKVTRTVEGTSATGGGAPATRHEVDTSYDPVKDVPVGQRITDEAGDDRSQANLRFDAKGAPTDSYVTRSGPQTTKSADHPLPATELVGYDPAGAVTRRISGRPDSTREQLDGARPGSEPAGVRLLDPKAAVPPLQPAIEYARGSDNKFTVTGTVPPEGPFKTPPLEPSQAVLTGFTLPDDIAQRSDAARIDRDGPRPGSYAFTQTQRDQATYRAQLKGAPAAERADVQRGYFGSHQYWIDQGADGRGAPTVFAAEYRDATRPGEGGTNAPHVLLARTNQPGTADDGSPTVTDQLVRMYADGAREDDARATTRTDFGGQTVTVHNERRGASGLPETSRTATRGNQRRMAQGLPDLQLSQVVDQRFDAKGQPASRYTATGSWDDRTSSIEERTDTFAGGKLADTKIHQVDQTRDFDAASVDQFSRAMDDTFRQLDAGVDARHADGKLDVNTDNTRIRTPPVGSSRTVSDTDIDYDAGGGAAAMHTVTDSTTVDPLRNVVVDKDGKPVLGPDQQPLTEPDANGVQVNHAHKTTQWGAPGGTAHILDANGRPTVDGQVVNDVEIRSFDPDKGWEESGLGDTRGGHQYRQLTKQRIAGTVKAGQSELSDVRRSPLDQATFMEGHDDDWLFDHKQLRLDDTGQPTDTALKAGETYPDPVTGAPVKVDAGPRHDESLDGADKFQRWMDEHQKLTLVAGAVMAVGGIVAAPFSGGASLALTVAGVGLATADAANIYLKRSQGTASWGDVAIAGAGVALAAIPGAKSFGSGAAAVRGASELTAKGIGNLSERELASLAAHNATATARLGNGTAGVLARSPGLTRVASLGNKLPDAIIEGRYANRALIGGNLGLGVASAPNVVRSLTDGDVTGWDVFGAVVAAGNVGAPFAGAHVARRYGAYGAPAVERLVADRRSREVPATTVPPTEVAAPAAFGQAAPAARSGSMQPRLATDGFHPAPDPSTVTPGVVQLRQGGRIHLPGDVPGQPSGVVAGFVDARTANVSRHQADGSWRLEPTPISDIVASNRQLLGGQALPEGRVALIRPNGDAVVVDSAGQARVVPGDQLAPPADLRVAAGRPLASDEVRLATVNGARNLVVDQARGELVASDVTPARSSEAGDALTAGQRGLDELELATGRRFADPDRPLVQYLNDRDAAAQVAHFNPATDGLHYGPVELNPASGAAAVRYHELGHRATDTIIPFEHLDPVEGLAVHEGGSDAIARLVDPAAPAPDRGKLIDTYAQYRSEVARLRAQFPNDPTKWAPEPHYASGLVSKPLMRLGEGLEGVVPGVPGRRVALGVYTEALARLDAHAAAGGRPATFVDVANATRHVAGEWFGPRSRAARLVDREWNRVGLRSNAGPVDAGQAFAAAATNTHGAGTFGAAASPRVSAPAPSPTPVRLPASRGGGEGTGLAVAPDGRLLVAHQPRPGQWHQSLLGGDEVAAANPELLVGRRVGIPGSNRAWEVTGVQHDQVRVRQDGYETTVGLDGVIANSDLSFAPGSRGVDGLVGAPRSVAALPDFVPPDVTVLRSTRPGDATPRLESGWTPSSLVHVEGGVVREQGFDLGRRRAVDSTVARAELAGGTPPADGTYVRVDRADVGSKLVPLDQFASLNYARRVGTVGDPAAASRVVVGAGDDGRLAVYDPTRPGSLDHVEPDAVRHVDDPAIRTVRAPAPDATPSAPRPLLDRIGLVRDVRTQRAAEARDGSGGPDGLGHGYGIRPSDGVAAAELHRVAPRTPLPLDALRPEQKYLWVLDEQGAIVIAPEVQIERGGQLRTVKHGDLTPSADGGFRGSARAGGELQWDARAGRWNLDLNSSYSFANGTWIYGRRPVNYAEDKFGVVSPEEFRPAAPLSDPNAQALREYLQLGGTDTSQLLLPG